MIQQSPVPSAEKNKDEPKTKLVVGLSLGACILIIGLVLVCFVYRKKCREGKGEKERSLALVFQWMMNSKEVLDQRSFLITN